MINNVAVMRQLYRAEYLVEDFCVLCFFLGPLDRYCRNENWNSILEGLMLNVWCLWSCSLYE